MNGGGVSRCSRALAVATLCTLIGPPAAGTVPDPGDIQLEAPLDCAVPLVDDRCEDFVSVFDNEGAGGWNFLNDMQISPSGDRVYVTGTSIGTLFDTVVSVYDSASGDALRTIRWDAGNTNENPHSSELSPDGLTLYVTGAVVGRRSETISGVTYGYWDFGTVAFDLETGTERWVSFYDAPGLGIGAARASALSSDGTTLFVAGENSTPGSGLSNDGRDFLAVAYRAEDEEHPERSGEQLWATRYDVGRFDEVTAAILSSDDTRFYVTGNTGNDGMTIAFDAATGERLWAKRLSTGGRSFNAAIEVTPDGSRVLVGGMRGEISSGDGSGRASLTAYDAVTGNELWSDVSPAVVPYNALVNSGGHSWAIGMSRDGRTVFHAGSAILTSALREIELYTAAVDVATGARRWSATEPAPGSSEQAWGLTTSPSGDQLFVTGYSSYPGQGCDALTAAYSTSDGERLWTARYPWLSQPVRPCSSGQKVSTTASGNRILVAGQISNLSDSANPFNIGLLGYDLTISQLPASPHSSS